MKVWHPNHKITHSLSHNPSSPDKQSYVGQLQAGPRLTRPPGSRDRQTDTPSLHHSDKHCLVILKSHSGEEPHQEEQSPERKGEHLLQEAGTLGAPKVPQGLGKFSGTQGLLGGFRPWAVRRKLAPPLTF